MTPEEMAWKISDMVLDHPETTEATVPITEIADFIESQRVKWTKGGTLGDIPNRKAAVMLVDELAGRRIYIEEVPIHGGDASATGRGLVEAAYEIGNALYIKLDRNEITPVPDLFIGGLDGEFLNIEYLED